MDLNLNHSGEMIEDLLGNNREMTINLRDALKNDSTVKFRLTAILGIIFGFLGMTFLLMPFIPKIIPIWIMAMAVGMIIAGLFGKLFAMPLIDSVSVHLKVIDYVDNVIKNTDYRRPNLMDDPEENIEEGESEGECDDEDNPEEESEEEQE